MLSPLTQAASKIALSNTYKTRVGSSHIPQEAGVDHIQFSNTPPEKQSFWQKFQHVKRTYIEQLERFLKSILAKMLSLFPRQPAKALKPSQVSTDRKPAKRLKQDTHPVSRPTSSRRTSATTNRQARPLSTQPIFEDDLKSIHFQQKRGTQTCYLLAAFDNIFNHPQGQKILDLIKIDQIENGYEVTFPGQPDHPITVHHEELGQYVQSKTRGVAILEQAYLKTGVDPYRKDSTYNALVRMFGKVRVEQPWSDVTTLAHSGQTQDSFADICTGMEPAVIDTPNAHYYSVNVDPENHERFHLVNPFNTRDIERSLTQEELTQQFYVEINRILLNP